MNTLDWRAEDRLEGSQTYLNINTFALFDRSAIFTGSADLRNITFAGRHSVRSHLGSVDCGLLGGGGGGGGGKI